MSQPYDDPREAHLAELLRKALDGEIPEDEPIDPEAAREVQEALSAAAFLKNTSREPLLSEEFLKNLSSQVSQEARFRLRRRQRLAFLGGASLLAAAASILLLLVPPPGPRPEKIDARYPTPPVLTEGFEPGSSPRDRIDPVYEAGLRGYREARFLGAHYARSATR